MVKILAMSLLALGVASPALAAVEVTCVCMRYARVAAGGDIYGSERIEAVVTQLYTTTDMRRVRGCSEKASYMVRAREVNPAKHFNCRALALEDMPLER